MSHYATLHLSLHAGPSERSGTLGAGPNYFLTISYLTLFQSRGGRLCPSHEFVPTKRLVDPVSIMEGVRLCLSHKLLSYQDFRHSGPPALILVSTKEWRMKIAERAKGTIRWFFLKKHSYFHATSIPQEIFNEWGSTKSWLITIS